MGKFEEFYERLGPLPSDDTNQIPDVRKYELKLLRFYKVRNRFRREWLNKKLDEYGSVARYNCIVDLRHKGFLKVEQVEREEGILRCEDFITKKGRKALRCRSVDFTPQLLDTRRRANFAIWISLASLVATALMALIALF